ncbi:MAG: radical SAM protein [Evtepia sp.]|uniref:radical SAM protein n=1 Tax=Evtepia sp. TaxID=2773933 RepID=UPI002A765510|nr:radical SAM protein [Evtepia sp.]MDY3014238.1 radical SAM protein [Evtepia sp.]
MHIQTKQEILEVLSMPAPAFWAAVAPAAQKVCRDQFGDTLLVTAMLAYSNICKNQCLYCGMRAGSPIPRYRMSPAEILPLTQRAREAGLGRMFPLSGDDGNYGFDNLLTLVEGLRTQGFSIALGAGELEPDQYRALHSAGVEEYVLKFEMSHPDSFNQLNPSTTFQKRMEAAQLIKEAGMKLASGNIVDWPGQTLDELADDILLMKELDISWAPNIPYLPALHTPLASRGGPGSRLLNNKEIALVRLLLPGIKITAQQPGEDLTKGLADEQGNLDAIACGANLLFCDLLPDAKADAFRPIDRRNVSGLAHCQEVARRSGLTLDLGG